IRPCAIAAETPCDAALLNRVERRHILCAISERSLIDSTIDHGPGMYRGGHTQFFHARELSRGYAVDMGENPTQVLDGILVVDGFDLIEKSSDRVLQFGMDMQRQSRFCNFRRNAPPLGELIGFRI